MIVRNLRLNRGWSQRQLAEVAGLNVRTIQRVEKGDKPGLETAMALDSIFEVDVSTINSDEESMESLQAEHSKLEAIGYAQGIREFYTHVFLYFFLAVGSLIHWGLSQPLIVWFFFGWGVIVATHGLISFDKATFIGPRWEKKIIERRLGKKL